MLLIVGTREPLRVDPFGPSVPIWMDLSPKKLESSWPRYEAEFNPSERSDDSAHLNQFILHSAIDMVDDAAESSPNMYLKIVDRFNEHNIFAFVTASNIRFLLLRASPRPAFFLLRRLCTRGLNLVLYRHEGRNEEAIRSFFVEVYEVYVKLLMNPFYQHDTPILSPAFDQRIHALARRYLAHY